MDAVLMTPSPTLQSYWGLNPSLPDPTGGWLRFEAPDLNIAVEYPSVFEQGYEEGGCGDMFVVKKEVGERKYHLIGFGSSIRISVYEKWDSDMDDLVNTGQLPSNQTLVSDVERFSIGGEPAFRYIHLILQDPVAFEYQKVAWAFHGDRLYWFSFMDIADLPRCDAPPLSEDDVFEHMLASVEFLE